MKTDCSLNSNSVLKVKGIPPGFLITMILFVFFSFSFSKTVNAQVVVLNSSECFTAMDGNPIYDSDGPLNGTLTMTSLTLLAGGSITNNDPALVNPCNPVNNPAGSAGNITIIGFYNPEVRDG